MRGRRYRAETNIRGGDRRSAEFDKSNLQFDGLKGGTANKLANEYGVSVSTIERDDRFARSVDILPDDIKTNVLGGKDKISQSDARAINNMEAPIKKQFLKEVEKGTPIKEAVKKVDPELKRKERDDFVRAEMQRKQEMMFTLFMKNA